MIDIKKGTVYMMVGPSGCGKSHLARSIGTIAAANAITCSLLSTDANRTHMTQADDRYALVNMYASQKAFDKLYFDLEQAMQYPYNSDVIVIDSTGLSEEHRKKVKALAFTYFYNVEAIVFDYKDETLYTKYLEMSGVKVKDVMYKQLSKLKRFVLPVIKGEKYNKVTYIRRPEDTEIALPKSTLYPTPEHYFVVGDVHGQSHAFQELIKPLPENTHIVLLGDIVDKGDIAGVEKMFDYVLEHNNVSLVMGNHENWIRAYICDELDAEAVAEHKVHFPHADVIKNSPVLKEKFLKVIEKAVPFFATNYFIATHSICPVAALGKYSFKGMKLQRNFRYAKREDFDNVYNQSSHLTKELEPMLKESQVYMPVHVFGHIPLAKPFVYKNLLGIDTGAGVGGTLTGALFTEASYELRHVIVGNQSSGLPTIMYKELVHTNKVIKTALEPKIAYRIKKLQEGKVNFISGTMSPCASTDTTLESVESAIAYYRGFGVKELVMQPKYMGSRCQMYIKRNVADCYAVSRNGFVIKEDLSEVFKRLAQETFNDKMDKNIDMVIYDGELMPWYVLGKGLIEQSFGDFLQVAQREFEVLKSLGFDSAMTQMHEKFNSSVFAAKVNSVVKEELVKEIGERTYEAFNNFRQLAKAYKPCDANIAQLEIAKKQLALHGASGNPYYVPFQILKFHFMDGTEKVLPLQDNSAVMESTLIVVDDAESVKNAVAKFKILTQEQNKEGVVIKPRFVSVEKYAPYVKVRNPEYLTLTYGFDYLDTTKHTILLRRKHVTKKMNLAVSEWAKGVEMLKVPYDKIVDGPSEYVTAATELIADIEKERDLDPRL